MYNGDRARKDVLVEFGFRLPSALDNRPLMFHEYEAAAGPDGLRLGDARAVRVRGQPRAEAPTRAAVDVLRVPDWERAPRRDRGERTTRPAEAASPRRAAERSGSYGAEQLIRPTGLLDPEIEVKPTRGQIDDLMEQIGQRTARGERVLVTTLTKRMAEDLADFLREANVKVHYLHSEVDTLERVEILRDLRLGVYDVVVGINLLREGLDLPEVSLVAILDADKEGYLRSNSSLIQTIGRAARHVDGHVIMYADQLTDSHAARDRRDVPPARQAAGVQRGARHHADGHPQGDPRHHRARQGRGPGARGDGATSTARPSCRRTSSTG